MMIYSTRYTHLSFGLAFDIIREDTKKLGMRLPSWKEDVIIRVQMPDENSKMTAPYFYVESRFGRVPWKETMIELFSKEWVVVEIKAETINDICKNDEVKAEQLEQNNVFNKKTLKEKANEIHNNHEECCSSNDCGGSQECKKKCLHECDNKNLKIKKNENSEKVKDDNVDETLANFIMYLHWLGYDFF